jgi:hypothetical protein
VTETRGTIPLARAPDKVTDISHDQKTQLDAMDEGKMDGWEGIGGCAPPQVKCYVQYEPRQIPSLAALARGGAISDAFFSRDITASWGAHIDLFAQTLDGFVGNNPEGNTGKGWGCNSNLEAEWIKPGTTTVLMEPSCIPDKSGKGPFRASPVPYVPTIADRMEEAGRTWGIYGTVKQISQIGYKWSICPTFAECLNGPQKTKMHDSSQLLSDAKAGTLPSFSIVAPAKATGQHNGESMIVGDNMIGQEVAAIQNGPEGSSTTIFIYYDDCGCFYDHVAPPAGLGIRSPLVIVSPFAKKGFTDHNTATNSSVLAYAESVLKVKPVTQLDASAYNFHESFTNVVASPTPFAFKAAPVPPSSQNLNPPEEGT